ncbi:MAG: site-specific integrase [Phycisphaerales bacterium]|nr:MAG: site-specific integrase [Phycisphaerales bacterium]
MNKKVAVSARWYGRVPTRNGKPLPSNQWARAGRKRRWSVRWYSPDGTRPREMFDTRDQAEEFAREKTAEFESLGVQARVRPEAKTLGEFVDELLALRIGPRGQRLSVGAAREYRTVLKRFAEFVGRDLPLLRVTMADGIRYLAAIRSTLSRHNKPLSPFSVNKHKSVLKSAFNVAVDQLYYLRSNPFSRLKKDKLPDLAIRYVSPAEYWAIADACRDGTPRGLWWEAFLAVSYTAATRLNETAHLTWPDIDFEANTIRVVAKPVIDGVEAWRPKDYDSRTIPVPVETMNLLTRMHTDAEPGTEFVFLSPTRVEWIRAKRQAGTWSEGQQVLNNTTREFKRLAGAAGVENVTLHDLRRSCITHWARKLPAAVVQELAGHADIHTTLRYYVSIRSADMVEAREVTANALQLDPKWTQIR